MVPDFCERLLQELLIRGRKPRNNACLVGPPGVGKTAVVEGRLDLLAARIMWFYLQDTRSPRIGSSRCCSSFLTGLAMRIAEGKARQCPD